MPISLDELTELIRYHLAVSAPSDAAACMSLIALGRRISSMSMTVIGEWLVCDHCSCSVHVDVLQGHCSNWSHDGDFLCASCLYDEDGNGRQLD